MRKPFENKKSYDPGRLTHKVTFVQDQIVDKPSGGTGTFELNILNTWAGKENMSNYTKSNIATSIGATFEDVFTYFTIRNRKNFFPDKTMFIRTSFNEKWQIVSVKPMDDPLTIIQLACVLTK